MLLDNKISIFLKCPIKEKAILKVVRERVIPKTNILFEKMTMDKTIKLNQFFVTFYKFSEGYGSTDPPK